MQVSLLGPPVEPDPRRPAQNLHTHTHNTQEHRSAQLSACTKLYIPIISADEPESKAKAEAAAEGGGHCSSLIAASPPLSFRSSAALPSTSMMASEAAACALHGAECDREKTGGKRAARVRVAARNSFCQCCCKNSRRGLTCFTAMSNSTKFYC